MSYHAEPTMTWILAFLLAVAVLMMALLFVWLLEYAGSATRSRFRDWHRRR